MGYCACRKLDSDILMMKSAQDWATKNVPGAIDGAIPVHPCSMIDAYASRCSISCTTAAHDEDAARRTQQRGQGIPCGSNRSAFQHIRFAKVTAATLVDRECPLIEVFG